MTLAKSLLSGHPLTVEFPEEQLAPSKFSLPIVNSLRKYAELHNCSVLTLLAELKYDATNRCHYFMRHGVYHGVESNGHIHT